MNASKKLALAAAASLSTLVAATTAQAVPITYSLGGDLSETVALSNGLDAEVTINADNFTVDITPGVAEEVFFTGGSVQFEAASNATGTGTLSPTLTITSPAATPTSRLLTQQIQLAQTLGSPPFEPASNSVVLAPGSPVFYNLGGQYELRVTPLDDSRPGQEGLTATFSNSAEFLLTPIPEPTSAVVMAAGGALLLARRRR